jgi:Flp pilus assembly protein CpaB
MKTAGFHPRSPWVRFVSSPFFLAGMLVVILGGLWVSGLVNPCWFGMNCAPSTEGLIAVPVSAQAIPAFTQLNRQHVWNAGKGQLAVVLLPPEQVTDAMKTNLTDILGRVLGREKPAGYVFTEADFLPPGSRPGLVGGIPPGKRAVRVEAGQVSGLYGLNPGDRFDLIATLPIDADGKGQSLTMGGAYGQQLALQANLHNWAKQATVRVLVQNGVLVQPLTTREIPLAMNTLTQGLVVKKKPVQEIVIAVDPEEVASLTEAVAVKAEITTIPRSGHPDDPRDSQTPESQPWSPFGNTLALGKSSGGMSKNGSTNSSLTFVETVSGSGEREFVAVPVASDQQK